LNKTEKNHTIMKKNSINRLSKILSIVGLLFIITAGQTDAQNSEQSLLWEISGNGLEQPSYLFGTFHLLQDEFLETKPEVLEKFHASEQVMVEVEIDSSQLQQLSMMAIMQDDLISNHLSEDEELILSEALVSLMGVGLQQVDRLKPMALSATISLLQYQMYLGDEMTQYEGEPIDQWFVSEGRLAGKQLVFFETMEEQMDLIFNSMSVSDQADLLVGYLEDEEGTEELIRRLFDCYVNEDITCLEQIGNDMYEDMPAATVFLDVRNENWMRQIPSLIETKASFIAVGALHLIGEQGLVAMLQREGYRVVPVNTNPG
jgi:uncharacterized protein YbaP (TraB family)